MVLRRRPESDHLTILGGGVAGLAAGHFAAKRGLPLTVYEAADRVGGYCITLTRGAFRFDSGAHRFHDKDPEVTREVQALLGPELLSVNAPSQIYFNGRFIQFPLTPINALKRLGLRMSTRAVLDLIAGRLASSANGRDFESFAVHRYGRTMAEAFLLGYSEKLWGTAAARLSPSVSGQRLSGLNLRAVLWEAVRGGRSARAHLDGAFYYPAHGYGEIADALAARCGERNVRLKARVTRLFHDGSRIDGFEINGQERIAVDEVVSTLPLTLMLRLLEPQPPAAILAEAAKLRFRNVVLVAVFINQPSITRNATIYFPSADFWFTRIYEPKNRSPLMAPPDQTSLVAEIPCQHGDAVWGTDDTSLISTIRRQLATLRWYREEDVIDACAYRIPFAYPVLEVGFDEVTRVLVDFLSRFTNLHIAGRSGRFAYTHVHDLIRSGSEIVESYCATRGRRAPAMTPTRG